MNNFAISSGGIGQALERSASSLAAANSNIDESIALVTAANTVVQDPEVVGTALKTISMRIRGAKTELEAAGLETEGMATSTAKLRKEILALSGVDIMLNDDTFKSPYKIMDELARKWSSLTDIQQASITELIAGKRQGNIVSSIMTNFDVARSALATSASSEGSAMKEHEKWMESMVAKINQLKAAWEGLSQAFLSSSFLKGLIDTGTGALSILTDLINKIGTLPTLLTLLAAGLSLKNSAPFFKIMADDAARFGESLQSPLRNIKELIASYNNTKTLAGGSKLGSKEIALFAQNKSLATAKTLINEYNTGLANCGVTQSKFISSVSESNQALGKYFNSLNSSKASLTGFVGHLVKARAAMVGLRVASVALNAAATIGFSLLVSGAFTLFDKLINGAKEAKEQAQQDSLQLGQQSQQDLVKIEELYSNYTRANIAYKNQTGSKEALENASRSLLEALGVESSVVNSLINDYSNLNSEIQKLTGKKLNSEIIPNLTRAYSASLEKTTDTAKNIKERRIVVSNKGKEAVFSNVLKDKGFLEEGTLRDKVQFETKIDTGITGKNQSYEEILAAYNNAIAERNALESEVGEKYTRQELSESSVYKSLNNFISDLGDSIKETDKAGDALNESLAEQLLLETLSNKSLPKTIEEYESFRNSLLESAKNSDDFVNGMDGAKVAIDSILSQYPELKTLSSEFQTGLKTISIDIEEETKGMNSVFSSIKESYSSTGLSKESISGLQSRFQDSNLDTSKLFEGTANGIRINSSALRELEKEYENIRKEDFKSDLDNLISEYDKLTEEINNSSNASEKAQKYVERDNILSQINDVSMLAAQYDGLTSAFHRWEEAQSMGEEGDMYDSLAGGLEHMQELYDEGLIGTNEFKAAVQLMTDEDVSGYTAEELKEAYENSYETMQRYFQEGRDGCENFISDIEDMGYSIEDLEYEDIAKIADELNINAESVESILRKLSDYGFDIDLDDIFDKLELAKTKAEEANEALINMGITDTRFDFGSENIEDINNQIAEAQELLKIDLDEESVENVREVIVGLMYQKQELESPAIMSIDTSSLDSETQEAIAKLIEFQNAYNEFEALEAAGYDIEVDANIQEAQAKCESLKTEVEGINPDILAKLKVDTSSISGLSTSIRNITPESLNVKITSNASVVSGQIDAINNKTINPKVLHIFSNSGTEKSNLISINGQSIADKTYSIYKNVVTTYITRTQSGGSNAQGTAFARGDWGTKNSGVALGGEVGQELIVRDGKFFTIGDKSAEFFNYKKGDIIFNAEQTRQILANGKITNGKKRGVSYAQGTAFASGSSDKPKSFDWIEISLDRIQRIIKNLEKIADSSFKTLSTRNNAGKKEIAQINKEISKQKSAQKRYMQEANSVGLSSSLASKVRNGTININSYSNETQDLIKEYQDWYEKSLDCADAIDELHESLAELYKDNFDNIQDDYEHQLDLIEHLSETYDIGIDKLEAEGKLGSTEYYTAMNKAEKSNLNTLNKELEALTKSYTEAMESGEIKEKSEAWYEFQKSMNDVRESIDETTVSIIKNEKAIRELKWEYFDFTQERIEQLTDEADFLIDLMEKSDLYDDNGKFTDKGMAVAGLHAQNYNVYMNQADQYAKEVLSLNKLIAEDSNNTELIERKEELLGLQQKSILAAQSEKEAMADLVEDGIDAQLDALDELIDKYKDSLKSTSNLYDYQKKVGKQTKEIASLQKQLSAYENDTSQENRARIQQIKVDLAEAQEELAETEYDKFVDDTEKLLDNLYDEYESILNERLDNIDLLMNDMIDSVNNNSSSIRDTLISESSNVGYTMSESMRSIWSGSGEASTIVSKYGDSFTGQLSSIDIVLKNISNNVASMVAESNKEAKATTSSTSKTNKTNTKKDTSTKNKTTTKKSSTSSSSSKSKFNDDIKRGVATAIWIYGGSGSGWGDGETRVKRLTSKFGSSNAKAVQNYINAHANNGDLNAYWESTGKKKLTQYYYSAFKKGGFADYTGLAWLDGTPQNPEAVLNSNDTKNFISLRDILRDLSDSSVFLQNKKYRNLGNVTMNGLADISSMISGFGDSTVNISNSIGEINIDIPISHVDDYDDFLNQMRKDDKFEKLIQAMTIDRLAGGSTLSKNKYKWN